MAPSLWLCLGLALAAEPAVQLNHVEAPASEVVADVADQARRTVVWQFPEGKTRPLTLQSQSTVPAEEAVSALIQAAAAAGIQIEPQHTSLILTKAATRNQVDRQTHVIARDGSVEQLQAVWTAAGKDAVISTTEHTIAVTLSAAQAPAFLAAIGRRNTVP